MLGLARTQTSTTATHLLPTQNQSLAKHNRKSSQLIENNHQRPESIASFCRVFLDHSPLRKSPPVFRRDALQRPVVSPLAPVLASGLPQGHARNRRGAAP
jgi:hypothetical protein